MRAILKDSGLPNEFWPEAVEADVYLRNRTAIGPEFDGQVVLLTKCWNINHSMLHESVASHFSPTGNEPGLRSGVVSA
jgi:hypothetical protein